MFASTVTRALARIGIEQRGLVPLPRSPVPMLIHKAETLRVSPDWTYEPKWDGFRVIAMKARPFRGGSSHDA
jgi:ATP-dependent DNA ligase